jgi:ATP-dependent helicase/nuclease subunit B
MEQKGTRYNDHSEQLTLHVGGEEQLFERAQRCAQPTELVVSPVELHQRNVQRRLREANLSKDPFRFADPVGIAQHLLEASGHSPAAIDRIDRLSLIRSLFANSDPEGSVDIALPSAVAARDPQQIEQLRTEVEAITNFHPERVAAWTETADKMYGPIDDEAAEFLEAGLAVERRLRDRTPKAISETELLRRATRTIMATNGSAWDATYPRIERLTLLGLSSLSAPHTDLVHGLLAMTSIEVHIHFRDGVGEYLRSRVPDLLAVTNPGVEVFD